MPETETSRSPVVNLSASAAYMRNGTASFSSGTVMLDTGCAGNTALNLIYNVYYADYENGIYFDVHLTEHLLLDKRSGIAAMKTMTAKNDALKKRDWHTFYLRNVPCPLQIYDFQRRYKDIEPEQFYGVWDEIHKNLDYGSCPRSKAEKSAAE